MPLKSKKSPMKSKKSPKKSIMKKSPMKAMKSTVMKTTSKTSTTKNNANSAASSSSSSNTNDTRPYAFLIKSEPISRIETKNKQTFDVKFSFDDLRTNKMDLKNSPNYGKIGVAEWDGVRNYLARNNMRKMKKGSKILFYHSNANPSGIVGIAECVREAYDDPYQFDPKAGYYDAKACYGKGPNSANHGEKSDYKSNWSCVDVKYTRKLDRIISLDEIKEDKELKKGPMELIKYGRLSVNCVSKAEWDRVMEMEKQPSK